MKLSILIYLAVLIISFGVLDAYAQDRREAAEQWGIRTGSGSHGSDPYAPLSRSPQSIKAPDERATGGLEQNEDDCGCRDTLWDRWKDGLRSG